MDLKFIGAEATAEELAVIERAAPAAVTVDEPGRVLRTEREDFRHLLLPTLDAVQSEIGWISKGSVDAIARRLHIPPAEIFSVATFYALLSTEPRPTTVVHVCDDTACLAPGTAILEMFSDRDDVVSSPCLGQCDRRPAAFVQRAGADDQVIAPATSDDVAAALDGATFDHPPPVVHPGPLTRRVGRTDPGSLVDYRADGGYAALSRALEIGPDAVIEQITTANLRGRGGAAFPTGIKWRGVADQPGGPKYVICNADESEPGTFKDRVLMEGDPFSVIEAITIAGLTIGAELGYVYIRGEYPVATERLRQAVAAAKEGGMLGDDVLGSGRRFDIEIRRGQGAYICGEETALFNSIEGFRGEPRQKPPFPTTNGVFGRPTVVNNVETLVNVNRILLDGGEAYAATGTSDSTGTRLFCLSGDVRLPGVYEVESGTTLGAVVDLAGGPAGDVAFVMLGGAAGSLVTPDRFDLPLTFEDARAGGVSLGSGVVMLFNTEVDMVAVVQRIARFFRDESCGQCVPCRVGTVRIEEEVARVARGARVDVDLVDDLDRAMKDASICGLGHTAATVVRSAIDLGILR